MIGWTVFHSSKVGHVTLLSQRGRAMLCICQQFASVVQYVERNLPLLVTSASDLPMRTNKFCSVPFSSSWSSVVVINKIHWCVAVCAVNCTVHRRSYCRHGRGSIFCDPTQPNPVANGPNPLRKIEAIIIIHSAQWSIKTRPQIFVFKYLCKYLSILIILDCCNLEWFCNKLQWFINSHQTYTYYCLLYSVYRKLEWTTVS